MGGGGSGSSTVECDANYFALHFLQASQLVDLGYTDAVVPDDEDVAADEIELSEDGLPSADLMDELFGLFFDKWHSILPCLYKQRVLAEIQPGGSLAQPNTLTFAILALAGYLHQKPEIKATSDHWARRGKECFDQAVIDGRFTMQAVQGGIYLCLRMIGLAELSQMWIFLASVWRMCTFLGFHQIDANSAVGAGHYARGFLPEPRSELEIEERRRTVWAVYILDRLVGSSVPWAMCVVDNEFRVNFPVSEEVFQDGSMEVGLFSLPPHSRCSQPSKQNVEQMVVDPFPSNSVPLLPPNTTPPRDAYQHLCKLAVLLGRILSFKRSTPSPDDCDVLDITLSKFLLDTPKPYRSMMGVSPDELPTVLLLGCVIHACTVFLHGSGSGDGVARSVRAVDNMVTLLRNVSGAVDPDDDRVLGNPLLGPTLLQGARIWCIRGPEDRGGKMGILLSAFGRMEEGWPKLAGLMKAILDEDLRRAGE